MKYCEINLAKDLVLSKNKRKQAHRLISGYLFVSSIVLSLAVFQAISNIMHGIFSCNETSIIKKNFKQIYPNQLNIKSYADELLERVDRNRKTAISICQALPPGNYSALPVLKSIVSQSDESSLHQLTFMQEDKRGRPALDFSITTPLTSRIGPSSAFIRNWQNHPELTQQLAAITPTTTRRGILNNEDVSIMNYRGTFKE